MNRISGYLFAAFVVLAAGFAFSPRKPPPLPPTEVRIDTALLLDARRAGARLVAAGEQGRIFVSADGADWRLASTDSTATLTALAFADARHGLAAGHDMTLLRSSDGGTSWRTVFAAPEQQRPLLAVLFLDAARAIAVGAYGAYLESADGGQSWTERQVAADDRHFNAIAQLAGGRLLLAGEAGALLGSDDGGAAWRPLPSPYAGSFFGLLPLADGAVLAYGMRGHIFRSADGGATWQAAQSAGTDALFGGHVRADGGIVLAGQNGVVLASADGGRSFARVATQASRTLTAVLDAPAAPQTALLFGDGGVAPLDMTGSGSP